MAKKEVNARLLKGSGWLTTATKSASKKKLKAGRTSQRTRLRSQMMHAKIDEAAFVAGERRGVVRWHSRPTATRQRPSPNPAQLLPLTAPFW